MMRHGMLKIDFYYVLQIYLKKLDRSQVAKIMLLELWIFIIFHLQFNKRK